MSSYRRSHLARLDKQTSKIGRQQSRDHGVDFLRRNVTEILTGLKSYDDLPVVLEKVNSVLIDGALKTPSTITPRNGKTVTNNTGNERESNLKENADSANIHAIEELKTREKVRGHHNLKRSSERAISDPDVVTHIQPTSKVTRGKYKVGFKQSSSTEAYAEEIIPGKNIHFIEDVSCNCL